MVKLLRHSELEFFFTVIKILECNCTVKKSRFVNRVEICNLSVDLNYYAAGRQHAATVRLLFHGNGMHLAKGLALNCSLRGIE